MVVTFTQENPSLYDGISLYYIAIKNLPQAATVEEVTRLFDAAGIVASIKLLPQTRENQNGALIRFAIVAYFSEEDAHKALKNLDENNALSGDPLLLEYFGAIDIKDVEAELEKRQIADELESLLLE